MTKKVGDWGSGLVAIVCYSSMRPWVCQHSSKGQAWQHMLVTQHWGRWRQEDSRGMLTTRLTEIGLSEKPCCDLNVRYPPLALCFNTQFTAVRAVWKSCENFRHLSGRGGSLGVGLEALWPTSYSLSNSWVCSQCDQLTSCSSVMLSLSSAGF